MYFSRACIVRVLPSKIIRDMDFSRMGKYHTQCKKWTFYRRQKYCIFRYNTNTIVCEPLFVIDLPPCFFGFKVKRWCGRGGDLNIVHSITVIGDPWFYEMRGEWGTISQVERHWMRCNMWVNCVVTKQLRQMTWWQTCAACRVLTPHWQRTYRPGVCVV